MKTLILFIFSTFLVGCGRNYVDPQLAPYVHRFEQVWGQRIQYLNIRLGTPSAGTYGTCYRFPSPRVVLDKAAWAKLEEYQKETLVFHELGHCLLGRSHTMAAYPNGKVASIMFPEIVIGIDGSFYESHRKEFLAELFSR